MRFCTLVLGALLLSATALYADEAENLQKHLQDRFLKQVLTIRNFYGGDHLSFDSHGVLVKGDKTIGHEGCWCAAQLEVEKIELKKGKLILRGPRIVGVYDSKKKTFSKLSREGGKVELDIELDAAQMSEDAIVGSLENIFLTRKDDMDSLIPDAWRAADFNPTGEEVARVTKDAASSEQETSAPRPIHTPDPEYSEEARSQRLQGSLVLWIVVDEKGNVARIRLNQCLGMGLDEQAVRAVSQWKFEPARKNGQLVAVQLNVEVTFHLYR